jgi:hypothetical protein
MNTKNAIARRKGMMVPLRKVRIFPRNVWMFIPSMIPQKSHKIRPVLHIDSLDISGIIKNRR